MGFGGEEGLNRNTQMERIHQKMIGYFLERYTELVHILSPKSCSVLVLGELCQDNLQLGQISLQVLSHTAI